MRLKTWIGPGEVLNNQNLVAWRCGTAVAWSPTVACGDPRCGLEEIDASYNPVGGHLGRHHGVGAVQGPLGDPHAPEPSPGGPQPAGPVRCEFVAMLSLILQHPWHTEVPLPVGRSSPWDSQRFPAVVTLVVFCSRPCSRRIAIPV